jgi:glycine betaine/proline transport system substrate-binding protein
VGKRSRAVAKAFAFTAAAALALSSCGGSINDDKGGGSGSNTADCTEPLDMAVNNWVGYFSNAYVIGEVAKNTLGCEVNYKTLDEQAAWRGFGSGEIDAIVENWGHEDLKAKYIEADGGNGDAVEAGWTGINGVIGWYVPPWMAKQYPDITNWQNLNKYADLFKTPESGDKGQVLDGDPGFVTNDAALVDNLNLNYEVVVGGSEAALIQSFRDAEKNHKPLLAYFYSPQWFFNEMKLVKVDLPKYTPGCDADPEKVDCDYPPYHLDKIVSSQLADSGSPAYTLIKNFKWTDEDQNTVSKYISVDGMEPEEAAQKWIDDNPDLVNQWLEGTGASVS